MAGIGGCPNVGGICIGCTMPGFPDKFMPFMDEPPGAQLSSTAMAASTAAPITALRSFTNATRQQGAEVAAPAPRADHRLSATALVTAARSRRSMSTVTTPERRRRTKGRQPRRDVLGPDHPHRRQPGHLHQDRLRQPPGRRVPQHVVDLPRLQHLHEGQGPARRPLHHQPHLRHLRRQPRHLRRLRPEHGVRRPAAGHGRVDHQPRRGGRVHVRPQPLPGQPGRRRLLRADGQGDQPGRAGARPRRPPRPTPTCTATAPSPTSCGAQPVHRRRSTARRCR